MDIVTLESALRAQFEPLEYAAFFGALFTLGIAEALLPFGRPRPERGRRWLTNYLLTALNIALMSALPLSGLAVADVAQAKGWGLFNVITLPTAAVIVLGVLLRSLTNYLIHVAMHKVPTLWRLHRVHHSDPQMDVSTAVRFHPLEFAISAPLQAASIIALGIPPVAIILYELFDASMAAVTHANIQLPARIERALGLLLVTPGMHRIHHSAWHVETDSNYGATLSLWDRLFGTLRLRPREELAALKLGLNECRDERSRSIFWLLRSPFSAHLARSQETVT
jgi:sterol desaturase/sphingolipid hydroxylase (fatty acid hydroxylase superfamily)